MHVAGRLWLSAYFATARRQLVLMYLLNNHRSVDDSVPSAGQGLSDFAKSALDSRVEATPSAPVSSRICFACLVQSELSQCTERRIPPFLTRPSYRFASYSGMPRPTSAPSNPPTVPTTPTPASAVIIGPAAINGPKPGIARAPIPANQPNAPPTTTPVPAPVAVPSGALVCFSCAKSFVPWFSGNKTETSVLR